MLLNVPFAENMRKHPQDFSQKRKLIEPAVTLSMFVRDTLFYFIISAATMYLTALLTESVTNIYILLPLRIAVAAVIYTTALFLCRSQELREAIDYVKSRKTSKQ